MQITNLSLQFGTKRKSHLEHYKLFGIHCEQPYPSCLSLSLTKAKYLAPLFGFKHKKRFVLWSRLWMKVVRPSTQPWPPSILALACLGKYVELLIGLQWSWLICRYIKHRLACVRLQRVTCTSRWDAMGHDNTIYNKPGKTCCNQVLLPHEYWCSEFSAEINWLN